jgi:hypothetical protein
MKTGIEFIQRMQEDAEFRQQVKACPGGEARLAFLKSKGYDFSPFIQILDHLSYGPPSVKGLGRPGGSAISRKGPPGFWGRIGQIFRPAKSPRPGR